MMAMRDWAIKRLFGSKRKIIRYLGLLIVL